jgi:hypothetical protein
VKSEQVSALDQQFPPPDQKEAATPKEIDGEEADKQPDCENRNHKGDREGIFGGVVFDPEHNHAEERGQEGSDSCLSKQANEPRIGREDEEKLGEGKAEQGDGKPLLEVDGVFLGISKPQPRIDKKVQERCSREATESRNEQGKGFDAGAEYGSACIFCMPGKDKCPEDSAAQQQHSFQVPERVVAIGPEGKPRVANERRNGSGNEGFAKDYGLSKGTHAPSVISSGAKGIAKSITSRTDRADILLLARDGQLGQSFESS